MTDELWAEAERLAWRGYRIEFERDTLSNGQYVFMARNPDLPGCKAQGATIEEAKQSLDEVRIDYIYALLEEELPIPEPRQPVITQFTENVTSITFSFDASGDVIYDDLLDQVDEVFQPENRELLYGMSLGGDLVKHG